MCNPVDKTLEDASYENFLIQTIDERDSLYVLHTVKELSAMNWWTFEDYSRMYVMSNDEVEYFIGSVFYNIDKTKMIVWVGEKTPNAKTLSQSRKNSRENRICPTGGKVVFSLMSMVGIRNCPNEMWNLYPLENQSAVCCSSEEECKRVLSHYYFHEMTNHSEYVAKEFLNSAYGGEVRYDLEKKMRDLGYGDDNSPVILKNYGYNLQDDSFWDKSLLWQKGARISGKFNFQLRGANEYQVPTIRYPSSIIERYSECRN